MEVDVNKPVENPYLKELLEKRLTVPQEEQLNILNQIAHEMATKATFLAVVSIDKSSVQHNPDGTAVFTQGTEISFPMLSNPNDGSAVQPVFTDWEELRNWDPFKTGDVDTVILTFDDIYSMMSRDKTTICVNPFGKGAMFPFDMLDQIKKAKDLHASGVSQQVVKKDTKVLLGDPQNYPQQMVDAVKRYAEEAIEINAIWLKLMEKEGEQSFLLVVDAIGDARSCFPNIANAAVPFLPKGMYLDMVPFESEFGQNAATGEPFFRR